MASEDDLAAERAILLGAVKLLVDRLVDTNKKNKPIFFIGAGVSVEYGIPTAWNFAKQYFNDPISGLTKAEAERLEKSSGNKLMETFIRDYTSKLTTQDARIFFQNIESAAKEKIYSKVSTYDWIVSLWQNDYIDLVFTTNFDSLLIETGKKQDPMFDIKPVGYGALNKKNNLVNDSLNNLIQLAGNTAYSKMLWTQQDFQDNITEYTKSHINQKIYNRPLILLGYTASEDVLREVLEAHEDYKVSVDPKELNEIKNLHRVISKNTYNTHVKATASEFVRELYEKIYQSTNNQKLSLSFELLKHKIRAVQSLKYKESDEPKHTEIPRNDYKKEIESFLEDPNRKASVLFVHGNSGVGKSYTLEKLLTIQPDNEVRVFIRASELFNYTIEDYFDRFSEVGYDFKQICHLLTTLSNKLVLIIDGINELYDNQQTLSLIENINRIAVKYHGSEVIKTIVSCRTDFLEQIRNHISFKGWKNREYLEFKGFAGDELVAAIDSFDQDKKAVLQQDPSLAEFVQTPQTFQYLLTTITSSSHRLLSERDIYSAVVAARIRVLKAKYITRSRHHKLPRCMSDYCALIEQNRSLRVDVVKAIRKQDISNEDIDLLEMAEVLRSDRMGFNLFRDERLGEYIYARFYLYETQFKLNRVDIETIILSNMNLAKLSGKDSFGIHIINALIHFIGCLNAEQTLTLFLSHKCPNSLVTAAAIRKKQTTLCDAYLDEPILCSVSLLDKKNHANLFVHLTKHQHLEDIRLPLNYAAKIYPSSYVEFIQYCADQLTSKTFRNVKNRTQTLLLMNTCLAYGLRHGFSSLKKILTLSLLNKFSKRYWIDIAYESLHNNSRSLFHNNSQGKLSDISLLPHRLKVALITAARTSVFTLDNRTIVDLIEEGMVTRLLLKFIFCMAPDKLGLLNFSVYTLNYGNPAVCDFTFAVYGWLSKFDESYLALSQEYIIDVQKKYPEIFYHEGTVDGSIDPHHQYDPLVPHVTSLLLHNKPIDISPFFNLIESKDAFRIGRLAQKLALDFPEQTISMLNDALEQELTVKQNREVVMAMRILVKFSPYTFWQRGNKQFRETNLTLESDGVEELNRIISQIRDFDWFHVINDALNSTGKTRLTRQLIIKLVQSKDLKQWLNLIFVLLLRANK